MNSLATPLRAIVVDDEALARERLVELLVGHSGVDVIDQADSGSAAVRVIVDHRPDLVFLDVQMPGLDGFGVLRCTVGAHRPIVVFVTAYDQFAIQAFEIHAADYLLKPVSRARLAETVRRVEERRHSQSLAERSQSLDKLLDHCAPAMSGSIPIKTMDGTVLVELAEIRWLSANSDHVHVHCGAKTYLTRERLQTIAERLPSAEFVRVHRSIVVNARAVRSVESIAKGDYFLVLKDGHRIRSSRQYRSLVRSIRDGSIDGGRG